MYVAEIFYHFKSHECIKSVYRDFLIHYRYDLNRLNLFDVKVTFVE